MLNINTLRKKEQQIISIGSHPGILQSILDFDYMIGKKEPSLKAVISNGRKYLRFFFGDRETMIPVFAKLEDMPDSMQREITLFLNVSSGRRTLSSTREALSFFPNLAGGALFAENVPEKHSLEIVGAIGQSPLHPFIIGPASVGLLIPGALKLGAVGGVLPRQQVEGQIFDPGNVAVFSSSGGMTNELINLVTRAGKRVSFALSFGGDRFPVLSPLDAFMAAEQDKETEYIVYFGELGGYDEYDVADMIKKKKITKKVIAYIGGRISEMFETPPQFGHAKAMAARGEETAQAKSEALKKAGAKATNSFTEFIENIKKIDSHSEQREESSSMDPSASPQDDKYTQLQSLESRTPALFMNGISRDHEGSVEIIGTDILELAKQKSYGHIVASMLLGHEIKSKELADFTELVLKLLVDHGPYVSGAVNTMVAARAGKDLVASLAAGLLTIGPRFGGAVNQAAAHWIEGVAEGLEPYEYVERLAKQRKIISGIGHRKYRIDFPDPRVKEVLKFSEGLKKQTYTTFAKGIEKITTAKKGNLILNVDGAMAAVLLDMLTEKEGFSQGKLQELAEIEFFNAYFVLSRAVGFTAHYLDQRRMDEGLFRLSEKDIGFVK